MIDLLRSLFGKSKYEVKRNSKEEWYFILKSSNGETVLVSESYKNKSGATTGINSVRANATDPDNFEIKESKDSKFYFVLKSKNGEVIGVSETYNKKESAVKSINSLAKISQTDRVNYPED